MAPQVVTCCQPAAVTVLGALAFLCRGVCVPAVGALPFCPTPTGIIPPPPPPLQAHKHEAVTPRVASNNVYLIY